MRGRCKILKGTIKSFHLIANFKLHAKLKRLKFSGIYIKIFYLYRSKTDKLNKLERQAGFNKL